MVRRLHCGMRLRQGKDGGIIVLGRHEAKDQDKGLWNNSRSSGSPSADSSAGAEIEENFGPRKRATSRNIDVLRVQGIKV